MNERRDEELEPAVIVLMTILGCVVIVALAALL